MQVTPPPSPQLKGICRVPESRVGQIIGYGIRLTDILGFGAYGVVYKATDCNTGISCAVKALNRIGLSTRQQKFLAREIELHRRASSHPNVVTLLDVLESPDCTYVVMEYCDEGDLFTNITEHGHFVGNDRIAKRIFLQILDAVEFCHRNGIYHRDLKPENVLITDGGMTAKLADFGLACTDMCSSDFGCGSTFYMSPGILRLTFYHVTRLIMTKQNACKHHLHRMPATHRHQTMSGRWVSFYRILSLAATHGRRRPSTTPPSRHSCVTLNS